MSRPSHARIESARPRALIYVPKRTGPHPILCFLHGAGESAAHGTAPLTVVLEHRSPPWHAENGSACVRNFLVVCPQLETRRRWETTDAGWIDTLIRHVALEHDGDLSRPTLTGFSFGGEGAFQVASASILEWSAIWAVDPALQRLPPSPRPGVPVWVHYGKKQPGAENMGRFAATLGLGTGDASGRVVTRLNEDHANTCRVAYAETAVYEWLLTAQRQRD